MTKFRERATKRLSRTGLVTYTYWEFLVWGACSVVLAPPPHRLIARRDVLGTVQLRVGATGGLRVAVRKGDPRSNHPCHLGFRVPCASDRARRCRPDGVMCLRGRKSLRVERLDLDEQRIEAGRHLLTLIQTPPILLSHRADSVAWRRHTRETDEHGSNELTLACDSCE